MKILWTQHFSFENDFFSLCPINFRKSRDDLAMPFEPRFRGKRVDSLSTGFSNQINAVCGTSMPKVGT